VVGGVAVVLHGHPRFTADLDLVLALDPDNLARALPTLEALGYRPRAPVSLAQFADPVQRQLWIDEKSKTVFSLWSPQLPATEIDLFAAEPLPFEAAYRRALRADLGTATATVASLTDLIALKRRAGRPQDLADIAALEAIEGALEDDDGD
jgi:Nucleotidyl transferase AbiEii toxin, Type IV TA system